MSCFDFIMKRKMCFFSNKYIYINGKYIKSLIKLLINYDIYIRCTLNPAHSVAAQETWELSVKTLRSPLRHFRSKHKYFFPSIGNPTNDAFKV